MKKIFKGIAILFAVICLAGCASSKVADSSNPGKITVNGLNVNGKEFGATGWNSEVSGNTVTFKNLQNNDCAAGWYLCGLDFSKYKKVRITFESMDLKPCLAMYDEGFKNSHWWWTWTADKVIEANLSGEGADYIEDNGHNFDKSKGFILVFANIADPKVTEDVKFVVKSIQFIK